MKKFNLETLKLISSRLKKKGKKIGLCHGVFDVLHAGHVNHFNEAQKKCDYLFVTITTDRFVKKGPNRPINNHYFRARVIDSIKYIDFVGINDTADAIKSIETIKPNFYFKGKDFKNKKDHTGRLDKEILAIKKNKGKIVFTESAINSSTKIINKKFSYIFESRLNNFLSDKNKNILLKKSHEQLEKIKKLKVLIVGDSIIDQYNTVKALNKPIKENIIATRYIDSNIYLGGVFAAATNLSQFNNDITVCTVLGNDKDIKKKVNDFSKNIKSKIFFERNKITTRKTRFIDFAYKRKISEVYNMDDNFLSGNNNKKILNYLNRYTKSFDVVILIDYGHGFINNSMYKILKDKSKFLSINCQTNSANHGFNFITKYKKSDYVCIDEPELRLATSNNHDEIEKIIKNQLLKKIKFKNITITRGKDGCFSYSKSKSLIVPALISDKVIDTIGAGDVFLVLSSLLYSVKTDQLTSSIISNIAGALKVDILGHSQKISKTNFYSILNHILK